MFRNKQYLFGAVLVALVFFFLEIVLANIAAVAFALTSSLLTWGNKIAVLVNSIAVFFAVLPFGAQLLGVVLAVLVGIHASLVVYYFRTRALAVNMAGSSLFGAAMGVLGAGCASCGTVILSSLLGFSVSLRVITLLPLRGKEFGLIGIAILLVSIWTVLRKITSPQVCEVKAK